MEIASHIYDAVKGNGNSVPNNVHEKGKIICRCPCLNMRHIARWNWRKQHCPEIPDILGDIFLPPDFNNLVELMNKRPIPVTDMVCNHSQNFDFQNRKVLALLDIEDDTLPTIWNEYFDLLTHNIDAYTQKSKIVDKLDSILNLKSDRDSRTFEFRLPTDFNILSWSFILSPSYNSLEAVLTYRSIEVSRNIINDLYVFCIYFGYIFSLYEKKLFDIPISAINIFAIDAHIIKFNK